MIPRFARWRLDQDLEVTSTQKSPAPRSRQGVLYSILEYGVRKVEQKSSAPRSRQHPEVVST